MHLIQRLLMVLLIGFAACGQRQESGPKVVSSDTMRHQLEYANKHMVKTEERQINDYVLRHGLNPVLSPTGLRFVRYQEGTGIQAEQGNKVRISFKVSLINGIECYTSEAEGPKEFVIGLSDEVNGLEEGLTMMRVGDKARLIIPSHLAFGLPGDMNKIPMRATLIYDVHLLSVFK